MLGCLMQIHVNSPEVGTKQFDNLMNVAVNVWNTICTSCRKKHAERLLILEGKILKKQTEEQAAAAPLKHVERNQALANQDANSTGEKAEIVVLRDAEIQTHDVLSTEPESAVKATEVGEEVQWVAKQMKMTLITAQMLTVN
ncbi:hypothetical protein ACROYT_G014314 [Oculina patagonica]